MIRLLSKFKLSFNVKLSRKNIFIRDNYKCRYCGKNGSASSLTLDHVLPRSRGGKFSWDNLVTSCVSCNARKGDRTPQESGIGLIGGPPSKLDMYAYIRCLLENRQCVPEWSGWLKNKSTRA